MESDFEFGLSKSIPPEMLDRLDGLFKGDNLLQLILHSHLLIERGLMSQLETKFARPEVVRKRWSFDQKMRMYIGLFDPPKETVEMLRGFNRLRNKVAHDFQDEEAVVTECLPWESVLPPWARGDDERPPAKQQVRSMAVNLLFHLEVLKSMKMKPKIANTLVGKKTENTDT